MAVAATLFVVFGAHASTTDVLGRDGCTPYQLKIGDRIHTTNRNGTMELVFAGVETEGSHAGEARFNATWKGDNRWIRYQKSDSLNITAVYRPDSGRLVAASRRTPAIEFWPAHLVTGQVLQPMVEYVYSWNYGFFTRGSTTRTLEKVEVLNCELIEIGSGQKVHAHHIRITDRRHMADGRKANRPRVESWWVVEGVGKVKGVNKEFPQNNFHISFVQPVQGRDNQGEGAQTRSPQEDRGQ